MKVFAAMRSVASDGLEEARHLRGDIYEARASIGGQAFRVLFAAEGRRGQVLLALEAFEKKTQATPPNSIRLAEPGWRTGDEGRALDLSLDISCLRCHH